MICMVSHLRFPEITKIQKRREILRAVPARINPTESHVIPCSIHLQYVLDVLKFKVKLRLIRSVVNHEIISRIVKRCHICKARVSCLSLAYVTGNTHYIYVLLYYHCQG